MTAQAYPLSWPAGFKRYERQDRSRARFGRQNLSGYRDRLSVAEALVRLKTEVDRLKAEDLVVSSNMPTRRDGMPQSRSRQPDDPGVAVYFNLDGQPHCLPCDKWDRLADNIAAVAAHIDAVRAQERYGVGDLKHAFAGYKQLPPPEGYEAEDIVCDWAAILGFPQDAIGLTKNLVNTVWKAEVAKAHASGNDTRQRDLNVARDAALKELGV